MWTKKRKEEVTIVIIVDYITSKIKNLVLELEFINLKIECFDYHRQSQESCRLWKSYKKLEEVPSCPLIVPSLHIMSNNFYNDKILPSLNLFA